jgi:hypothetical protein
MVIYFLGCAQINEGIMYMHVRAVAFRLLPAQYSAEFISQINFHDLELKEGMLQNSHRTHH